MSFRILFASLFLSSVALATVTDANWRVISLAGGSSLKKLIYQNAIADSVIASDSDEFFPPIQHISRPFSRGLARESAPMTAAILKNMGVNPSTKPLRHGRFDKGTGEVYEYGSTDEYGNSLKTCVAFRAQSGRIHAYYTQASYVAIPNCSETLIQVSRLSLIK